MQNHDVRIHDIIKYNPERNYFGPWSPKRLHRVYREIYTDPFRPLVFMETGHLSAETICDTLWNEMSYNPVRFGEQNPFETTGIPNIKDFCKTHINPNDLDEVNSKIACELEYFTYFIGKNNPEFPKFGEIFSCSILINCDKNRKTGYGYKSLACLANCVHYIATQNINDYKIKKYREQINRIVITRHPRLKRSNEFLNFVQIEKAEQNTKYLYDAMLQKNKEILDTTSLIKIFKEYDPPIDTSREQNLLSRQREDLQRLEEQYAFAKNKYDKLITRKQEIEKK